MYSGSLEMTRIGRYVRGSATAENTTENSVTAIGFTLVISTPTATTRQMIIVRWNRAACVGRRNLPHDHPMNCASVYPLDSDVSRAAPNVAATMPTITTARASLPPAIATGSTIWESEETSM